MDLIRILVAIILPPLGIFLQVGIGGAFWLNILLTLLGYIPGIVHTVWIIAKRSNFDHLFIPRSPVSGWPYPICHGLREENQPIIDRHI